MANGHVHISVFALLVILSSSLHFQTELCLHFTNWFKRSFFPSMTSYFNESFN